MRSSGISPSLVSGVKTLIAQAEAVCEMDPGLRDAAAMVYVGDVYALREEIEAASDCSQEKPC